MHTLHMCSHVHEWETLPVRRVCALFLFWLGLFSHESTHMLAYRRPPPVTMRSCQNIFEAVCLANHGKIHSISIPLLSGLVLVCFLITRECREPKMTEPKLAVEAVVEPLEAT